MEGPRGRAPSSHIQPPITRHPLTGTRHPCLTPASPPPPAASQPTTPPSRHHPTSPTHPPGTPAAIPPMPGTGLGPASSLRVGFCCRVEPGSTRHLKLRPGGGKAAPTSFSGTTRPFRIAAVAVLGLPAGRGGWGDGWGYFGCRHLLVVPHQTPMPRSKHLLQKRLLCKTLTGSSGHREHRFWGTRGTRVHGEGASMARWHRRASQPRQRVPTLPAAGKGLEQPRDSGSGAFTGHGKD